MNPSKTIEEGVMIAWIAGAGDIESKITAACPDAELWLLTPKLQSRVDQLLETGLYGNTLADVCGELICRGIEAAIAKGTIR